MVDHAGPARLLATPLSRRGRRLVLVVGATRENRAEALHSLRTKLLVAGPIALLLVSGLAYVLAGGGLRAVEAMRRRAAEISAARPGERLPVPPTGDELERLGRTLNQMLERLEATLARERGFVAEAGHELRTPLAVVRAELDFALHHAETEQELRDALHTASDETDRVVQLAADLLLIASSDQGEMVLRTERISAGELLESVRNRFAGRARGAARRLELDAPRGLVLSGDRLRLEQALGNLVENAFRYGEGTVRIESAVDDGHVELRVRDAGPGFPPTFLPRAFERFSRADHNGASGGAGLGLAIVVAVASAHGGRVEASNQVTGGADVSITLPRSSAIPTVRRPARSCAP